ncbi:MAG: terminase large subunit domain-containing protein [Cetobacterium sp.]|uniref:terminase large subunit domain-containing protein n=1 Tax=Cetobacterium sp. TaxID=2071632 RepID=UPI003EE77BDF
MTDYQKYLNQLLEEERYDEIEQLLEESKEYVKYNKLYFFQPYPYQMRFMDASKRANQRMMRSGNQTGKSYGASYEFAQHITGLYQDYYGGVKIKDSGHLYWCIGIDLDSTARVMQKALFGTANARIEDEIGTGAIPRDCIDFDTITKDGGRIMSCRIKHVDGGFNTVQFFGAAQGQDRLMGSVVKFVWCDEEPKHNSMSIYAQCMARTTTTDGHIMYTCTPEQGMTDLQRLFAEDETGLLYLDSASWDECPHIDEATIKRLLAGIPHWQHDMRRKGLPVLGSGAVFPFRDEDIMCEDIEPLHTWPIICSVDFSSVNDASVVVYCAHDPIADVYYVYWMEYIDAIVNKNPKFMSKVILNSPTPRIPVVSPHDGGIKSVNPESKARVMKDLGVNVLGEPFYNPSNLNLAFHHIGKRNREREPGLTEMRRLFETDKLKVCRSILPFFKEKAQMFYAPTASGGMETKGKDDAIDAIRYAILSLRGNRGVEKRFCVDPVGQNNGFVFDESELPTWDYE